MRRMLCTLLLASLTLAACTGTATGHGSKPSATASRLAVPAGVGVVTLDSPPEQGAGQSPTFRWEPVTAVARYQLFVRDGRGVALWAWQGTGTSVRLGGLSSARPAGTGGPRLVPGSSWFVIAVDNGGKVLAVSGIRALNP